MNWVFFFLALFTGLEHVNIFPYGSPKLPESFFICSGSSCRKCHSSFLGNCIADQKSNQAANNAVLLACFLPLSCLQRISTSEILWSSLIQGCGAFMLGAHSSGNSPQKASRRNRKCCQNQSKKVHLKMLSWVFLCIFYILLSSWTTSKIWEVSKCVCQRSLSTWI